VKEGGQEGKGRSRIQASRDGVKKRDSGGSKEKGAKGKGKAEAKDGAKKASPKHLGSVSDTAGAPSSMLEPGPGIYGPRPP